MLDKRNVLQNSIISLVVQVLSMAMGFITRRIFLQYLGLDTQGLNTVVGDTLNFLSLAELGVGSAIIYRLYKPIVDQDEDGIAGLMNLYRRAYQIIGLVILILGIGLMFFLQFIVKEQSFSMGYIRVTYIVQLFAVVATYFVAYKRSLLYADQKQYVCKIVDLYINILGSLLRILVLVIYRSYVAYLVIQLLQVIISNLIIDRKCNKLYPFLRTKQKEWYGDVRGIFKDTKDILAGKLGGYIWSSTDSIVVSIFNGLAVVGGMSNYKYITNAVKNILHSITEPMGATLGNYLQVKSKDEVYKMFRVYTFFRYGIASIAFSGLAICTDDCVRICFGERYALPPYISVMIALDLFIGTIYGPLNEMISLKGLFAKDKVNSYLGAFANLGSSILLVQYMGMPGVLLGTCISQMIFMILRSILVFMDYFDSKRQLFEIWMLYLQYFIAVAIQTAVLYGISYYIMRDLPIMLALFMKVLCCMMVYVGVNVVIFGKSMEFRYVRDNVLMVFLHRIKRK